MLDAKLKSLVDRIENEEGQIREMRKGVTDIYSEAKDASYNTKALRKLIAERRQKDRSEIAEAMDGYRHALGMVAASVARGEMTLTEAEADSGFSRSAIHREASHRTQIAVSGTKAITPCWSLANEIAERERIAAEAAKAERERKKREKEAKIAELMAPVPMPDCPPFLRRSVAA